MPDKNTNRQAKHRGEAVDVGFSLKKFGAGAITVATAAGMLYAGGATAVAEETTANGSDVNASATTGAETNVQTEAQKFEAAVANMQANGYVTEEQAQQLMAAYNAGQLDPQSVSETITAFSGTTRTYTLFTSFVMSGISTSDGNAGTVTPDTWNDTLPKIGDISYTAEKLANGKYLIKYSVQLKNLQAGKYLTYRLGIDSNSEFGGDTSLTDAGFGVPVTDYAARIVGDNGGNYWFGKNNTPPNSWGDYNSVGIATWIWGKKSDKVSASGNETLEIRVTTSNPASTRLSISLGTGIEANANDAANGRSGSINTKPDVKDYTAVELKNIDQVPVPADKPAIAVTSPSVSGTAGAPFNLASNVTVTDTTDDANATDTKVTNVTYTVKNSDGKTVHTETVNNGTASNFTPPATNATYTVTISAVDSDSHASDNDGTYTIKTKSQAETYIPATGTVTVPQGGTVPGADTGVTNMPGKGTGADLPTGTTVTWSGTPSSTTPGTTNVPATVTYPDGSTEVINIPVKVTTLTVTPATFWLPEGLNLTASANVKPTATDMDGNIVNYLIEGHDLNTWAVTSEPSSKLGLTYDPATGILTGTVVAPSAGEGMYGFDVQVTDDKGTTTSWYQNNKLNFVIAKVSGGSDTHDAGKTFTLDEIKKLITVNSGKAREDSPDSKQATKSPFIQNMELSNVDDQGNPVSTTIPTKGTNNVMWVKVTYGNTNTADTTDTIGSQVIKVVLNYRTYAEQYDPSTQEIKVPKGGTPVAETGIPTTLPTGTTVEWDGGTPDTSTPTPDGDEAPKHSATITYPDGSKDHVDIPVRVTPKNDDTYTPTGGTIEVIEGNPVGPASSGITNKGDLPGTTTYEWTKGTPSSDTPGTTHPTVTVTYPDGSKEDVPVTVKVYPKPTPTQITVDYKSPTPDAQKGISNFPDLPTGTTVEWKDNDGDGNPDAPKTDTPGTTEIPAIVTYPNGETVEVKIPVKVNPSDADENTPVVTPITVPEGGTPRATDGIGNEPGAGTDSDLPKGTTVEWKDNDGDGNPDAPKTDTPGDTTGTVVITYPDGSSEEVTVPIKVTPSDATNNDPKTTPIHVNPGVTPDPKDGISTDTPLPDGSTIVWDKPGEIDTTNPTPEGQPDPTYPATITYPDGSKDHVDIPVHVDTPQSSTGIPETQPDLPSLPVSGLYTPKGQDVTVKTGEDPDPKGGISTDTPLPDGTQYEWETPIDTTTAGDKPGVVVVTYPDGSKDTVDVTIHVVETSTGTELPPTIDLPSRPITDVFTPKGQDVTVKTGEDPDPRGGIVNIGDLPKGSTVEWKTPIDTTTVGDKPGVVVVTYPDGSTDEVPVTVHVTDPTPAPTPDPTPIPVDTDKDGTPDTTDTDDDNDGVNDSDENTAGTDPKNPDSDGDGVNDGREDADGDGINNDDESDDNGTTITDKDGDGVADIIDPADKPSGQGDGTATGVVAKPASDKSAGSASTSGSAKGTAAQSAKPASDKSARPTALASTGVDLDSMLAASGLLALLSAGFVGAGRRKKKEEE